MDYQEKLRLAKEALDYGSYDKETIEYIFPELKESENERIRKEIIRIVDIWTNSCPTVNGIPAETLLAWLEKQGSDSIDDSKILQRFAFYTYEDEPDILYLANVFVNEDYRSKGIGSKIIKIADTVASGMGCDSIRLQCTKGSDAERLYKNNGYNELTEKDQRIWLEKQCEKKLVMIQWKGNNLKEVIDFTGKDKNFEKWFKSFEEYEKYVDDHNGIFKLFNTDGSHYEVPIGSWIVKTPDGYNVASKAIFKQKHAWSEEDDRIREGLIEHLKELKEQSVEGSHLKCPELYDTWIDWLEK